MIAEGVRGDWGLDGPNETTAKKTCYQNNTLECSTEGGGGVGMPKGVEAKKGCHNVNDIGYIPIVFSYHRLKSDTVPLPTMHSPR